jgi:pimeloyl-ACP methyl ester carboxylesterase
VELAGELSLPRGDGPFPLVFILHHSGPVTRDAYGYMAELMLPRGFAVFRFDKRGTGASGGSYGCCEGDDGLAAYSAAVQQPGVDRKRVFIVAQSIGTSYLAERFAAFAQVQPPRGVALLSNLLTATTITSITAPALILVADSETNLAAIGADAAAAHQSVATTTLYIAEGAEHTLFDVRDGPIDWSDPSWVQRYHRGAMKKLLTWLAEYAAM